MTKKRNILLILLLVIVSASFASQNPKNVCQKQLENAFYDLEKYYRNGIVPPYKIALENLNSVNDSIRQNSAMYIYALCTLSLADEKNGRSEWYRLPYFNETWGSKAQKIREHIAYDFGETARSVESIKIAKWFVQNDYIKDDHLAGIKVIRRIKCPDTDKLLSQLVSNPNSYEYITTNAIEEIAERNLIGLSKKIDSLQNHYRLKIRTAASSCAKKFNLPHKDFNINQAVTPWIVLQYKTINNLILDQVPEKALFVTVLCEIPYAGDNKWTAEYTGWIIAEDSTFYTILDYSSQKIKIEKKISSMRPVTLKDATEKLMNFENSLKSMHRFGVIRLHAGYEILPYFTMASWCFNNNLKDEAATLIFEVINRTSGDSTFAHMERDVFGHLYFNELLYAFSKERNYQKAITFSDHLSKKVFSDYKYRRTAIRLGEQLRNRNNDFITLTLPSQKAWDSLKFTMIRNEQIDYLLKRLKLLNCIQESQPGGISYKSTQYSIPSVSLSKSMQVLDNFPMYNNEIDYEVINPYNELLKIELKVDDIMRVAPYLANSDYILAYSFFRDFQPQRILYKVNWVVADIILNSVGKDFTDMNSFDLLNDSLKQDEIAKIIEWCRENRERTGKEITINILESTYKWSEFEMAMEKCFDKKFHIIPVLAKRINDFNDNRWISRSEVIAETIFGMGLIDSSDIEIVHKLLNDTNSSVRFWSSLYLIKFSCKHYSESFKILQTVLDKCDGITLYPQAIETLLQMKNNETFAMAEGILDKPLFKERIEWDFYGEIIKKLFLAVSDKAFLFLKNGLNNTKLDKELSSVNGKAILYCDRYIKLVDKWKNNGKSEYAGLSVGERKVFSKYLVKWLENQFYLLKTGKQSDIQSVNVPAPVFRIDAPGF